MRMSATSPASSKNARMVSSVADHGMFLMTPVDEPPAAAAAAGVLALVSVFTFLAGLPSSCAQH